MSSTAIDTITLRVAAIVIQELKPSCGVRFVSRPLATSTA